MQLSEEYRALRSARVITLRATQNYASLFILHPFWLKTTSYVLLEQMIYVRIEPTLKLFHPCRSMTKIAFYVMLGLSNYACLPTTLQYLYLTHSAFETTFYVLLDRSTHDRNLLYWNQREILLRTLFIATLYDPCELRYFIGLVTVLTVTLRSHWSVPGSKRSSWSIDLPLAACLYALFPA